ncbi:MAG: hypothetical protein Q9N67_03930 [Ghiorsea sp.]|nr:hypothetical protein [Ghiorsea sp.]MDQ7057420.1 hypothetical protein [Ghiorsea sp.]MDQ7058186.1 hypothetical protein [Ghiorsea sp.]
MSYLNKLLIVACISSLMVGCSSKKEVSQEPAGISYKTNEVTVRQCADISDMAFRKLLEDHDASIKKQMSPHLYIVTWDDDRHADEVVYELKKTTMFCGVDKYEE